MKQTEAKKKIINITDYMWKKDFHARTSRYLNLFATLRPNFRSAFDEWDECLQANYMRFNTVDYEKCNATAMELLEQGRKKFEVENWCGAMESYNRSLCYAEAGSEVESLAYANRSACFFQMELYGKAMADVEMALKANKINHNSPILPRLLNRRFECCEKIKRGHQPDTPFPKLSFTADRNFPCMANVLEIRDDPEFGRHIVAKCDIEVGRVLLVSEVFASGTVSGTRLCCSICNKMDQNLIACVECSNTMFCSGTCYQRKDVHLLECKSIYHLIEDTTMKLAIQTILMAIKIFEPINDDSGFGDSAIANLVDFVEQLNEDKKTPKSSRRLEDRYGVFLKLMPYLDEERIVPAYQVYTILMLIPKVREMFDTDEKKHFLMHLTLQHLTIIPLNSFRQEKFKQDWIRTDYIYDVLSLINHSCAPNLFNYSISDDISYCIAVRPIWNGEQIFINYIGNQCKETKEYRQKIIKSTWGFECKCTRCKSKVYPHNFTKNEFDQMNANPSLKYIREHCSMNYCKANNTASGDRFKLKQECKKFLQEFGHLVWSTEIQFVTNCFTLH